MVGFYSMPVVHEKYGDGKLIAWDGRTVTVRYQKETKRYWFPRVFTSGELKPANKKDEALLQEITERWINAVVVREATGLNDLSSEDEVQNVMARAYSILSKACEEEQLAELIAKSLSALLDKKYSKETVKEYIAQAMEGKKATGGAAQSAKAQFNKASDFTGGAFANFGINFLTTLATIFSLGIAYPFMVSWKLRWEAEHTIINGHKLTFDGNGGQLLGKYIIWWLLSIVTFGVYYLIWMPLNMNRWITKHTHLEGVTKAKSKFDGHIWQYFGVRVVARLVSWCTLGIGSFWAHCYLERWYAKHTSYDGYALTFDGTGMQYFGKCIIWVLLTVVTLGIYGFWLAVKTKKWTISHTHVA